MQLLCILLAANRVHTVNFQAFLASDEFSICLVTIFVFVFFNICICVVRYLYYLDILAVHALLGNKTSNHSSDPPSGLSKAGSCISVIYKYLMVLLLFSSPTDQVLKDLLLIERQSRVKSVKAEPTEGSNNRNRI